MKLLDLITQEQKYYLIGLFQGDGSIETKRRILHLQISIRDQDIIYKIRDVLSSICNTPIKTHIGNTNFKKDYESITLGIHKKRVIDELNEFIPCGYKSFIVKPPSNMSRENKFHWLRGLTDADGSLGLTKTNIPFWSMCTASEDIKQFLVKDIKSEIGMDIRINRTKQNIYSINLYLEESLRYLDMIYNSATIYMDRKYLKYSEAKKWIRTTKKALVKRKIWVPEEDAVVLSEIYSWTEKCQILERTLGGVTQRYRALKNRNK